MTARLGPTQHVVLLILADGDARSADRIDSDALLSSGRARGALRGLYGRGLVEPQHTGTHGATEWSLTGAGQQLAEEVHSLDEAAPVCPHGTPEDWPCKPCRVGLWRCTDCQERVPGGYRFPHRRDQHGEDNRLAARARYVWAGDAPAG